MDKTQKKAGTIGAFRYQFKIIFSKVRLDIWVYIKEHVALTLVILIVAGVTSIFSANGILDKALSEYIGCIKSDQNACTLAILSLLHLMWGVIFYPVKIHHYKKEQEIQSLRKALVAPHPQIVPDAKGKNSVLRIMDHPSQLAAKYGLESWYTPEQFMA